MSQPAAQPFAPGVDLERDDDGYLLLYMAEAATNRPLAEAAFLEFVRRHEAALMGFCYKQRFETFGDGAEDFVNATFLQAFDQAGSFESPAGADATTIHRAAQNWLFTILRNLFLSARRKLYREIAARKPKDEDEKHPEPADAESVDVQAPPSVRQTKREGVSARRRTLTLQFLDSLTGRDRAIFLQTLDYIDPATGNTEPPRDELKALAAQFNVPTDHIRIYRKRILDRLHVFIFAAEISSS